MSVWYIADTHFVHQNIIKFCKRPFKNCKHMDNSLIANWNSVVQKNDIVRIVGDFTIKGKNHTEQIGGIIKKLNGRKQLILGNHDYLDPFTYIELGMESVHTSMLIEDKKLFIAHDPALAACMPPDHRMVCGHVHKLFKLLTNPYIVVNVGVDVCDFHPISEEEVLELAKPAVKITEIKEC